MATKRKRQEAKAAASKRARYERVVFDLPPVQEKRIIFAGLFPPAKSHPLLQRRGEGARAERRGGKKATETWVREGGDRDVGAGRRQGCEKKAFLPGP